VAQACENIVLVPQDFHRNANPDRPLSRKVAPREADERGRRIDRAVAEIAASGESAGPVRVARLSVPAAERAGLFNAL
jgi:hypothetical protein